MVEVQEQSLSFNEAAHEYRLGGQLVPSVTEIIAPLSDLSRVPRETLEYKRSLGKAVHKAIELWEGDAFDLYKHDPAVIPYFEGWLRFKRESGFRAVIVERPFGTAKLRFAGTPDVIGTRTGPTLDELLDVKCVHAIDPATGVQLGGYDLLLEDVEDPGIKIRRRGAVQLMPDGSFRYHEFKSRNDRIVFLSCLNLFNWKRNCK